MKLQIRVNDKGIISDVKFKTFGCGSAIASSSYMTERVMGLSLEEAGKIKNTEIAKELCLPPVKLHCSSKSLIGRCLPPMMTHPSFNSVGGGRHPIGNSGLPLQENQPRWQQDQASWLHGRNTVTIGRESDCSQCDIIVNLAPVFCRQCCI